MSKRLALCAPALIVALAGCSQRPVTLSNPSLKATVNPSVGRLVRFTPANHANLLYLSRQSLDANVLANDVDPGGSWDWGGDKVWNSLQADWKDKYPQGKRWPPPDTVDGFKWFIDGRDERSVTIRSPRLGDVNAVVRRRFTLDEKAPAMTVVNTIRRFAASDIPVHVWSVSQVDPPAFTLIDRAAGEPVELMGEPAAAMTLLDGGSAIQLTNAPDGSKLGVMGRWIAAVYDDLILVQSAPLHPDAFYGEQSSVELFTGKRYVELETLSPLVDLQAGESLTHVVTWRVLSRPRSAAPEALVRHIRKKLGEARDGG